MGTGDKVLALLAAKVACCVGITLAASGLFVGVGRWLMGGGFIYVALALIIGIAAVVLRFSPRRPGRDLRIQGLQ